MIGGGDDDDDGSLLNAHADGRLCLAENNAAQSELLLRSLAACSSSSLLALLQKLDRYLASALISLPAWSHGRLAYPSGLMDKQDPLSGQRK